MTWSDQNPPAHDVILQGISLRLKEDTRQHLEIDRLVDDVVLYRLTAGNLFGSDELACCTELEPLVRLTNALQSCRTLEEARAQVIKFREEHPS